MEYSAKTRVFLTRHGMHPEDIDLKATAAAFLSDMMLGLAGRSSSLRMIPTYLSSYGSLPLHVPTAVIDAGGTNFRTALVTFTEAGPVIEQLALSPMPGSEAPVSWDDFISFAANRLHPLLDRAESVGFCFSYPTEETPDRDGRLISLTKQVKLEGFEGRLICADLSARLAELGAGEKSITLLNDTPAVLLSGLPLLNSGEYDGLIGLISGTGTNTCCELPVSAIRKLGGNSGRMLVNLESGGFTGLPRGDFDEELDNATSDPGIYRHEKMTSGAYIGELCRLTLRGAVRDGLFSNSASDKILALNFLASPVADKLAANAISFIPFDLESDRNIIFEICYAIFDRAARCVAANLTAILILTDTGKSPARHACICADGAMFKNSLSFRAALEEYMSGFVRSSLGRHAVFHTADNATIIGSAAAALLHAKQTK